MQGTSAQHMHVEMGNGLPPVGAVVDDDAVAGLTDSFLSRGCSCCQEEGAEQGGVFRGSLVDARDTVLRNNKKMDRCLRGDVSEGNPIVSLSDNGGGNFPSRNFLEKGHGSDGACGWKGRKRMISTPPRGFFVFPVLAQLDLQRLALSRLSRGDAVLADESHDFLAQGLNGFPALAHESHAA